MARSSCTKSSVSIDLFNLPPLLDMIKHPTMICEIPNDFFLLDGKNTQLSKVINTWTFDRLTPNGNEGVGVKLDYLECTYGTRYYVIDKVNGDINAIHNESLELTEFKGHFSPFDLENLEAKICRLAHGKDKEDVTKNQDTQLLCLTDPRTLNMEMYEGMGFDENNYSPIPPVSRATSQSRNLRPTSTPKLEEEQNLNSLDPTHNRGKINRVNSFESAHKKTEAKTKMSKGGPFKSTGMKGDPPLSGSNQMPSRRSQLNCTACGGHDHLRKDCHEDVFCNNCRMRSHTTEMCRATSHQATGNIICIYCGSVNHTSGNCHSKHNDNREEPRSTPRDLREQGPRIN